MDFVNRRISIAQSHQHLVAVDSDFVARGILGCRHAYNMSVANIKLRAVSWTYQAITIEFTVAKSATVMRAQVFDAINLRVISDEHNIAIEDLHGLGFSGMEFIEFACVMEVVADDRFLLSFAWICSAGSTRIAELGERSMPRGLREPIRW